MEIRNFGLNRHVCPRLSALAKYLDHEIKEELDYEREKKLTQVFANIFNKSQIVHIPKIIDKLSTKRLLTMSWLDGDPILNFKNSPKETRNTLTLE